MQIFVVNCGSSSIKYRLIEMPQAILVCSGLVDRIGFANSILTHKTFKKGEEIVVNKSLGEVTHSSALAAVVSEMMDKETGVIQSPDEIDIVGHRVLHGGDVFSKTVFINNAVKNQLKKLFPLGPLHLPANYMGIEVAEQLFTKAKQVAVFDTAFHQTMPPVAYRYAIDNKYYLENGVRVYGFHGTSHKYVSEKAMTYLNNTKAKIITIHLGNGCSMAAINAGKCVDTSMGLGPLSGMVMGTRCGDIDPSVIFHLMHQTGITVAELQDILNKKSGMLGLCGLSDMRDIKAAIKKGDVNAALAYELYAYRIKKYVGSYIAVLNGVDAIVFTGGIGENDAEMRSLCLSNLDFLGIVNDELRTTKTTNTINGIMECQSSNSLVKVLVVPTNEELEIANQCYDLAKE
jgi:acetate kinase